MDSDSRRLACCVCASWSSCWPHLGTRDRSRLKYGPRSVYSVPILLCDPILGRAVVCLDCLLGRVPEPGWKLRVRAGTCPQLL